MDKFLTILPPEPTGAPQLGNGTRVFFGEEEVRGVQRVVLSLGADEVVTAEVTLAFAGVGKVEAHPLLSLATLEEAAKHYGLALIESADLNKVERLLQAVRDFDAEPESPPAVDDPVSQHNRRKL